ncbi:TadE family type IV pilus minor pilin [Agreia sp. COWG]|uniref:TadE family type IV pilus minor pilin n=1 Tax=Agreia sp. COWG TaxID=2773266 RepID=UPI001F3328D8|nr:TadE family type IV pilus minor pilin [Agreia sp. COWG]
MTAEFVTVLPAVFVILVGVLGGFQLVIQQLRVADASSAAARLLGRADESGASEAVNTLLGPDARLTSDDDGRFVCASITAQAEFGPAALAGISITSRACALAGGQ